MHRFPFLDINMIDQIGLHLKTLVPTGPPQSEVKCSQNTKWARVPQK